MSGPAASGGSGLRALGGPLLALGLLVTGPGLPRPGAAAPASDGRARVVDVRVDARRDVTRVVFELDAPARHTVAVREAPRSSGEAREVVVRLHARGAFDLLTAVARTRVARSGGLVESLRMERREGAAPRASAWRPGASGSARARSGIRTVSSSS